MVVDEVPPSTEVQHPALLNVGPNSYSSFMK